MSRSDVVPVKRGFVPVKNAFVPLEGGRVPVSDEFELGDYLVAVSEGDDGATVPAIWTPEHVQARLVAAFEVLQRSSGAVRPKAYGNNWPQYFYDDGDRNSQQQSDEETKRQDRDDRNRDRRPGTAYELSLMNEALAWPLSILRDTPVQSDALLLWAWASAEDRNIRDLLRTRAKRVKAMIAHRQKQADDAVLAKRKAIAVTVAGWANERLAGLAPGDAERADRIRANAAIRFERAVNEAGAHPVTIRRSDVMPGRVTSRTRLDAHRKQAAAIIARHLNTTGVMVR